MTARLRAAGPRRYSRTASPSTPREPLDHARERDRLVALTPEGEPPTRWTTATTSASRLGPALLRRHDDVGDPASAAGDLGADDGERHVRRPDLCTVYLGSLMGDDDPVVPLAACLALCCRTGALARSRRSGGTRTRARPSSLDGGRAPGASARRWRGRRPVRRAGRQARAVPAAWSRPSLDPPPRRHVTRPRRPGWRPRRSTRPVARRLLRRDGARRHNLVGGLGTARANGLAVLVLTSGVPTHLGPAARGLRWQPTSRGSCARRRSGARWRVRRSRSQGPCARPRARPPTGRPGTRLLELPADVLTTSFDVEPAELDARPERDRPSPLAATDVERAASLLAGADRPLLVAGGGVVLGDASAELRRLAARLGAAATATQMGLGTVSSADPAFFGHGGLIGGEPVLRALREADVVLLAGSRVSSWLWEEARPPSAARPTSG